MLAWHAQGPGFLTLHTVGMVVHACNLWAGKVEAGGAEVQGGHLTIQ